MKQAAEENKLRKEQPFVLGIPARDIYPEMTEEDETMLVQGIIDVCFEEDGELVVLDYKTDKIFWINTSPSLSIMQGRWSRLPERKYGKKSYIHLPCRKSLRGSKVYE